MTQPRELPKTHGLLLDHDPHGNRRLSITQAGPTRKKNGKRLQYATGTTYQRCFQHVSTILHNHEEKRLIPQEEQAKQYYPITQEAATQIRLMLDAVGSTDKDQKAENLARAIAEMHPCESGWWYACHRNRSRPKKVLEAITLMYA